MDFWSYIKDHYERDCVSLPNMVKPNMVKAEEKQSKNFTRAA